MVGPSALPFQDGWQTPHELTIEEIREIQQAFRATANRALQAGFRVLEIHGAHGYLINSFLSPLSNQREDQYGGGFENRCRFLLETVKCVREVWPDHLPLFVRLSATEWVENGWTVEDSVELAKLMQPEGVDLIDSSSGGNTPKAVIPVGPGYQVPLAEKIKREAGIPTAAVGMISEPFQADQIIRNGQADLVLLAREFLREPNWPLRAAKALHFRGTPPVPAQYLRAF